MNGEFKSQMLWQNMRIDEKTRNVHFQWERDSLMSYSYTPFPYTHTLWKASDLLFDVFSHIPRNLNIIKYSKIYHVFYFSYDPPKKSLSYGTE